MIKLLYKLFGFAENKCDQLTSDYVFFRFTNKCCNKCKFCVDRFTTDRGDTDLDILLEQSKKFPNKIINITGGEPLLFPNKLYQYVKEMSKTNQLVLNTSLPKAAYDNKDIVFKIFEMLDVIDISFHGITNEENDAIYCNPAGYDKLDFIRELCEKFKDKITVSCVLQKGGIDSYDKFIKRLNVFKNLGCTKLYFNEMNAAIRKIFYSDPNYVSINEILGHKIKFKSPYSYGCHIDLLNFENSGIDIHIRRQCYRSGSNENPTWKDVLKEFINLFNIKPEPIYQLYEDGSISNKRSYNDEKIKKEKENEKGTN